MTTTENETTTAHLTDDEGASHDRQQASRSVRVRSLVLGGGCALGTLAVVGVVGTLGWQLSSTSDELNQIRQAAADNSRAEQVSLDYATGAADMDFQNPEEWTARLTAGTSPELTTRLQQAASSMQQLIIPLQWTSTASPIAATVQSEENGIYEVTTFVNVVTKNLQAPDGIESTATYKMSIDSTNDWQITQISGIGSSLTPEGDQAAPAPVTPR